MKTNSKILAVVLALVLIVGLLPISAFAENDLPATNTDTVVENPVNNTEETTTPSAPGEQPGSDEEKAQDDNKDNAEDEKQSSAAIFTVTFDANGHGIAPEAVTVTEGKLLQKPTDPAEDGYTFTGWYRDKEATNQWNFDTDTVNGDFTLYAGWTENPPVVTMAQPVPSNDTNTLKASEQEGEEGTAPSTLDDTSQDDGGEETVTVPMLRSTAPALMAPLQNGGTRSGQLKKLTLKSDGIGGVAATGYSGVAGTKVSLSAGPGVGHRFLKWEILSGEGSIDNPGSADATFTFGATDAVVQAIFTEAEQDETYVVVSYHFAEGTATATVDPNDPTTYYLIAIPADGCTFGGWSKTGTGTISNTSAASTTITGCSGRIEVEAFFNGNPTCPVTATANPIAGGTAEASWKDVYLSLDVDLKATPSVGYVFKEWRIKSGTGAIRNPNEAFTVLTGITGNVSCEAVFEAISIGQYGVSLTKNKPEGGEATASVTSGSSGTTVVLTAAPASGFRFEKWEVKAGGVTIDNPTNETATFNIGSDHVSVEACFKEERFSVTAIAEGGGTATNSMDTALPGEYIWLHAYDKTGVHFSHWEVVSGNITLANPYNTTTLFIMGNEAVEVKAVFVPEDTHCVRITNDGKGAGSPDVQTGKTGDTVTLTAAPNPGYKFKEWTIITKNGGTISSTTISPAQFTIGTGHATIRATFAEDPSYLYAIVYHYVNGASNSNPATYTIADTPLTLAPLTGGPTGHTFDGWYDNASYSGSPVTEIPAGSSGDKQFFAKWTLDTYNISYQNLKGASNSNPATYTITDTPISLVSPTGATGYTFDGWYDNASFSGNAITEIPANSTGDKTFYAKWTAGTYNISYQNVNGASNSNPATYTITDTPIPLVSPTGATGYTFDGWYDNASFSGNAIKEIPANSTGDKMFYAKWTAETYNISYQNVNGASNSNPATYTIADTPLTLADLTGGPTGYTFDGWYDNASFSGNAIKEIPANSTGDKTFYAKWTVITVTGITLNSDNAKKVYTEGDALDVSGLTLEVSKSDGSKETVNVTAAMVTGFDGSKLGTQTLTVSYEGFTATYEIEVKAKTTPPSPTYEATVQAVTWQKGSGKNLDLTFKRSEDDHLTYGLFGSLEIGGVTVGSANYGAAEGSLKLSIKPEYLETLSVGDHTVKVNFQDGSATVKLTVKAAADPNVPRTADESNPTLWSGLMFLSVAMLILLPIARKRKTER